MIVCWIANRTVPKRTLIHLCLFLFAFFLAFLPLALGNRDSSGGSYYVAKIKDVIETRIIATAPHQTTEPQTLPGETPTVEIPSRTLPAENRSNDLVNPPQEVQSGGASVLLFHFINNGYSSLARLPTLLYFQSLQEQVRDEIWNFNFARPIWEVELSIQNYLALLINLILVVLGVVMATKKFGLAGISALIIQIGYFIGNAAAATSGGRYLEPVIWVTLLYYAIGIFSLVSLFIPLALNDSRVSNFQPVQRKELSTESRKNEFRKVIYSLVGILAIGILITLSNNLPVKIPEQSGDQINQKAFQLLSKDASITATQWQAFLADPRSLVVEGIAFHPRYYRSDFYLPGTPSFELMVLGKQNVIVSYVVDFLPPNYLSDGSDVILVGCKIADDALWGAKRMIMRTYALFQIDKERSGYVLDGSLPSCSGGE